MARPAKNKVALYCDVPAKVKTEMERLAERHNRSLAGEVITALQEYIARQHKAAQAGEGGTE
jgi:hypothetical protein